MQWRRTVGPGNRRAVGRDRVVRPIGLSRTERDDDGVDLQHDRRA